MSCEDVLMGLLVLQHLHIDSRNLLEAKRTALDDKDCSDVGNLTTEIRGKVGRLLIAHNQNVKREQYTDGQEYILKNRLTPPVIGRV